MKKILFFIAAVLLWHSGVFAQDKIFYSCGSKDAKKTALSFDDGPGASTLQTLEILKKKGVKATFFMLGNNAAKHPKLARRVADDGHEIANHTYSHINFYSYKEEDKSSKIESELVKSDEAIFNASGVKPYLVRYPYGYCGQDALDAAKKNNYKAVNWSFGMDWKAGVSVQSMKEQYIKALKPGVIFLLHDSPKNAKELGFLEDLIDDIIKEKYEIVTVGELLGLSKQNSDEPKKEIILEEQWQTF
ncbi:MAG: polysaccharide deacetylase family protein [Endomicrobium sp.]|jgi:peptidoglycan/xylan/chitin deacetylase (PgdA/CDA1 family)|nr:polysaccharide deacetylase family protein [Endomicrobium sp.]